MDPFVAEEYRPLIPSDSYIAQCFKHDTGLSFGNQPKVYLWFRIIEGQYAGKELFMACSLPKKGKKLSPGHKYYKVWQFVNGRPPSKGTKLSPRLFKGRIFKIKTRTARSRMGDKEMSNAHNYSVVDEIVEVHVG